MKSTRGNNTRPTSAADASDRPKETKAARSSKAGADDHASARAEDFDADSSHDALLREREAHEQTRTLLHKARLQALEKARECDQIKERYEAALRSAQVYAFEQDRELRYSWIFNPLDAAAAQDMLGRTDMELGSSADQDAVMEVKRKVLSSGIAADCEAAYITPERRAEFALHVAPIASKPGSVERILSTAIDISRVRSLESDHRRLTEELATAAQGYEFALRGSNVAVFTQDRSLRYTSASKPMFGHKVAAIHGKTDHELMQASCAVALTALKNEVMAQGVSRNGEFRIQASGAAQWYDFHLEPMRDVSGAVTGITGAAVDITERKQGEAHLRLLLRELTHRSKNLLAVIQAMARQTAKHSGDVQSFVERFGERVQALARAHDLLVAESWRCVSLGDLVRAQLSYYIDREPELIAIDGPEVKLRPEAAQSLGLALHELATNAAKHGAMSRAGGRVTILWQEHNGEAGEKDGFELTWREIGGPKVAAPKRRGFGSMAIEQNLSRALNAEVSLDFATEGVTCRIAVPRSQLADGA